MRGGPFAHRLQGYDVYETGRPIRRLLPSPERPMIGPFVLLDHFGPARLAPGVRLHGRRLLEPPPPLLSHARSPRRALSQTTDDLAAADLLTC